MGFKPRFERPEAGNKYYNTVTNGGYSLAIKGSPTDSGCNVLSNCVGYAYGRFNEIGGYGRMKYLQPVNAENFPEYSGNLQKGQTPQVGACIVWQKGPTTSGSDGAGHVAIVEEVISPTEIVTSESGWGSSVPFYTKRRYKGDGNWGMGGAYKFRCFIYNPAVSETSTNTSKPIMEDDDMKLPTIAIGSKGSTVAAMQALLIGYGYSCGSTGADGACGSITISALKAYQKDKGLTADGVCGGNTWNSLLGLV